MDHSSKSATGATACLPAKTWALRPAHIPPCPASRLCKAPSPHWENAAFVVTGWHHRHPGTANYSPKCEGFVRLPLRGRSQRTFNPFLILSIVFCRVSVREYFMLKSVIDILWTLATCSVMLIYFLVRFWVVWCNLPGSDLLKKRRLTNLLRIRSST